MFKRVTEDDIKDMFLSLIKENGSTTTVDVKRGLRQKGFWIFQSTVSSFLNDNYEELGCVRNTNGKYFTYEKVPETKMCDGNCDGCAGYDNGLCDGECDDDCAECDIACDCGTCQNNTFRNDTKNESNKRAKIVDDPIEIDDDLYYLNISLGDNTQTIIISKDNDLENCGTLVYEVRSKDGSEKWYIYSNEKEIITRHRAIYYVWKVISQIMRDVKYKELRSTKMC